MELYDVVDLSKYKECAKFCNDNGYYLAEIDSENGTKSFQILPEYPRSDEEIINDLREQRELECFSIINQNFIVNGQSKTWFDTLTDSQKTNAQVWVQAWRDVTETKTIPEKPTWLK